MGVPVRDYKKTKNILMGTPASKSYKKSLVKSLPILTERQPKTE